MPSSTAAACGGNSHSGASPPPWSCCWRSPAPFSRSIRGRFSRPGDYIARIRIQGLIRDNQERVEALDRLGRSRAKAVIVHIDSPGGTTAGSQQLYDALRDLQARKPMVVVVDGLAASGAYIAALSADHIIAEDTSLVGSIGVLFQFPNFTDAAQDNWRQSRSRSNRRR